MLAREPEPVVCFQWSSRALRSRGNASWSPGLLGTSEARGMARVEERRGERPGRSSGRMALILFQLFIVQ